ncbi:hypothetical protein [Chloracidobacterium aggregatum]|uniref:Uncharacterized protein n=1 Tax=Chloracidobacterium sp. N TaxID=2821540 RepID=A0ABX8B4G0_9BACT|nr:hypothetical protein [Chloracidobacterium aggregatum]QUV85325.1 hypothetical protein J8C03_03340 [Chloracidobacterium sp. 2]QUV88275.1 hypothetical protein J8C07_02810 [Chloracidobacterium sp. S]QUV91194.1 hypothetical protein J8C04_01950 [Chloracidobacterium sp. A]QUV94379.1 hypothetical protein J8C05_02720 [Chloracidobacterium sp. N]QUV97578.1 hypothetical protein J8C00_03785 [Chloracidobacterium sp. E]
MTITKNSRQVKRWASVGIRGAARPARPTNRWRGHQGWGFSRLVSIQ